MAEKHTGFTFIPLLVMIVFTSCSLIVLHNAMLTILRQEKLFLLADDPPPPLSEKLCTDSANKLRRFCIAEAKHAPSPLLQWKKIEQSLLPCMGTLTIETTRGSRFKQPNRCSIPKLLAKESFYFIENLFLEELIVQSNTPCYFGSHGNLNITSLNTTQAVFIFAAGDITIKVLNNNAPVSILSIFGKVSIEEHAGAKLSIQDVDSREGLNHSLSTNLPSYLSLPLSYEHLEWHAE